MTKNEERWLEALKAGNYGAFEKLAAAYEGLIFNFALKMCGHVEDAKDVLQETLLAAFQSLRDFRGESKLSTWFFKVAMSACQKMRRKGKFQPDYELSLEQLLPQLDYRLNGQGLARGPEETALRRERKKYLDEAIRAIPLRYRLVLVLRDVQGFSTKEVSEILKLSVSVVKVRLHRARLFLRKKLREYLSTGLPTVNNKKDAALSDCRELIRLMSGYVDGDVDETLCDRINSHFEECGACVSLCQSLKETIALCRRRKRKSIPVSVRREAHTWVRKEVSKALP